MNENITMIINFYIINNITKNERTTTKNFEIWTNSRYVE